MPAISLPPHERALGWLARRLSRLPAPVKRALAGAPTRVDGQALDLDMQLLLRLLALAPEEPKSSITPDEARANSRRSAGLLSGPREPLRRVEDLSVNGPAGAIAGRVYEPAAEGGALPLLVYFHGGGWVSGDLDTHDGPCRLLAAHAGAVVLSIDYRRAPEHPFPAAVDDAVAALAWAAEHAGELGADPARIAVGGDSAGANLAAVVSRLARDGDAPPPAFQLLIYPVTDLWVKHPSYHRLGRGFFLEQADMDWFRGHYLPIDDEAHQRDPNASPLLADDLSGLAPAYIATAGFDPLRDEGEAYAQALRAAGVPAALRRHPGLVHGFANMGAFSVIARGAMLEAAGALRMGLAATRPRASDR